MVSRIWIGVGLAALSIPAAGAAQPTGRDAASNWSAIAACGAIDNADKRHACMDDVLRQAGVLTEARIARNTRQEFGRQPKPAKAAKPARVQRAEAARSRPEEIDQLVTTVKSVSYVGYRQLRVVTTEGSVWDQTQTAEFNMEPSPGDGFSIEKASLGSYLCRFGRSKSYRCKRAD